MRRLTLALLLGLTACGGTIDARSYSHACTVDADCVPVTEGDVCAECGCGNTAIALADKARFDADKAKLAKSCPLLPHPPCVPCALPAVQCSSGACALKN